MAKIRRKLHLESEIVGIQTHSTIVTAAGFAKTGG
jgi:hypothetical protein